MSNVTAVLECPGCKQELESNELPNTDWKYGTVRIVLIPTAAAVEHIFTCPDLLAELEEALAFSPSATLIQSISEGNRTELLASATATEGTIIGSGTAGAEPAAGTVPELAATEPPAEPIIEAEPATKPTKKTRGTSA